MWTLGNWNAYTEGEVYQTFKKCVNLLLKNGMKVAVGLEDGEKGLKV